MIKKKIFIPVKTGQIRFNGDTQLYLILQEYYLGADSFVDVIDIRNTEAGIGRWLSSDCAVDKIFSEAK